MGPVRHRFVLLVLAAACAVGLLGVGAAGATTEDGSGEAIFGTLQQRVDGEAETYGGVTITVSTADGEEIASVETADDGTWEVSLPGPGDYVVALDESTLPEGVALRDPDRNPLEASVTSGRRQPAVFALGEGTAQSSFLQRLIPTTVNGLQFGLIIAMTAIGLSLIFGTTGLVNFAHGELVTLGAIITYFLNTGGGFSLPWAAFFGLFGAPLVFLLKDRLTKGSAGVTPDAATARRQNVLWLAGGWVAATAVLAVLPSGLHLVLAAVLGIAVTIGIGAALERGLWHPLRLRRTGLITMLVISIGLSLLLRNALQGWFGGGQAKYAQYSIGNTLEFGPVTTTDKNLVIIALSIITLVGVGLMLQRTRIGKAMRAVADNRDLAESSGIDVDRIVIIVWASGAGLAAFGGVLSAADENVSFLLGFRLLLLMFAGMILGGVGTAFGALVGSLVVGLVTEWSTLFFSPELKFTWALFVLILILLVRPQGILGRAERFG